MINRFSVNIFKAFLGFGLLAYLSSCTLHRLNVQTQYLSHEHLASYYIGTPDPHLDNPTIGQRLLIQWSLSSQELENQPVFLHFTVRLRNHKEQTVKIPIHKKSGFYVYDLINQEYCQTGGILTYNIEIRNESCILASWKHPLWADLIQFDFSQQEGG